MKILKVKYAIISIETNSYQRIIYVNKDQKFYGYIMVKLSNITFSKSI